MESLRDIDAGGCLRDAAAAADCARPVLHAFGCLWGAVLLVGLGLLPAWSLLLPALLLSRAMTPFHEYYHTSLPRFPFLMRLIPVLLSPAMGGIKEQRYLHFCHHKHLGDPRRDPDHAIIHGPLPRALLLSFVQPEHSLWHAFRLRRLSRETLLDGALRALGLGLVVAWLGAAFLWYWIPARLLWTVNYLAFSRMLHREPVRIPWLAERLYVPIFLGSRWFPVYREHEVHHRFPMIRAEHLHRFRRG